MGQAAPAILKSASENTTEKDDESLPFTRIRNHLDLRIECARATNGYRARLCGQERTRPAKMQDEVPSADEQLKVLTVKLDLTDDQQAKIKPIIQGVHDATVKISQDQSLSREERLARVRPIRYKAHDQIREMLNDEQKKKLEQYMQGPHPEMHGNLSGATAAPQPPQN